MQYYRDDVNTQWPTGETDLVMHVIYHLQLNCHTSMNTKLVPQLPMSSITPPVTITTTITTKHIGAASSSGTSTSIRINFYGL